MAAVRQLTWKAYSLAELTNDFHFTFMLIHGAIVCEIANRKTPSLISHWVGVARLESVTMVQH